MKYLFGLPNDIDGTDAFPEERINCIQELIPLLSAKISYDDYSANSYMNTTLHQVKLLRIICSLLFVFVRMLGFIFFLWTVSGS